MSTGTLLFIALVGSASIVYLLTYLPIHAKVLGVNISPRLIICKVIAPFDSVMTVLLVMGGWLGLGSAVGLGMTVYSVASGVGLSVGAVFVRKVMVPKWRNKYKMLKEAA